MALKKTISPTLVSGGIATVGMILFTIGTYKGGTQTFIGPVVYLMYLIPLACGVIAALVARQRHQGYLGFRAALRIIFGILVVAMALQMIFTWLLVHLIDPRFGATLGPAVLIKMEQAYRHFGMPEDEIRRNIDATKGTDPFSLGSMFLGLARDYIIGFLISLVLAAIVKRKKPEERQQTTQ
ncbi:MAG TPA: DUF4199 domain-containing protein [Puia sp.]|jgi:hypothetical protein|nr:DUF4199 domain-containing protein [Puia sp.]